MLLKRRSFTAVAVLSLGLGIGANTAVFSVINAVLLRSLPFAEGDRLVMIWETHADIPRVSAAFVDFQDWRAQAQSFQEMAAYSKKRYGDALLTGQGEPSRVHGSLISRELFPMLGLEPIRGRTFLAEEEQRANDRVVILSHDLWQRSFVKDPDILGKNIQLDGNSFTVVGIMGEQYPPETDFWLPLSHLRNEDLTSRMNHSVDVIGRLRPGVTLEQARREMQMIAERLQQLYPATNRTEGVELLSLRDQLVGNLRPVALLVFGAVGLILLIACANVSNLLLAQSSARQGELALRSALGAGRGRLVRQLLSESLMLALLGGIAALMLAAWSIPLLRTGLLGIVTGKIPGLEMIGIDWRTLGFLFAVTLVAGILFGALPALQASRVDPGQALKEGGKSLGGVGRRNLSGTLVITEVALAVIVLVCAGLVVRSFQKLLQVDPGFRADHLLSLKIDLPPQLYQKDEQVKNFYQQLMPRILALPGVQQAALIDRLPFAPSLAVSRFVAEGHQPDPGQEPIAQLRSVDQRFFDTMQIGLNSGRLFDEADLTSQRNQVIINEAMARRFFAHQGPIGKHLVTDWGARLEIIGVVADIKDLGLDAPVEPEIYWPGVGREAVLLVRTAVDPLSLAPTVRQAVRSIDPAEPMNQARSVEEILSTSLTRRRFSLNLLGALAVLALVLAAVGIYGVVAYSVAQRTQEIGIRLALGAGRGAVFKLVIGRGLRPAMFGLAVGLIGAFALTRLATSLITGFLFEVRAGDPLTFVAIASLLTVVAPLACYLPARRATKVDPIIALRHE
jgi:putative ABC transport system permease protein